MQKITLQYPVERKGGEPLAEVAVRKPNVGELRGMTLTDILRMDVKAMERLLPRVTQPALLPADVVLLDPSDFLALAGVVVSFFANPAELAAMRDDSQS
jgi:hypothetical protein